MTAQAESVRPDKSRRSWLARLIDVFQRKRGRTTTVSEGTVVPLRGRPRHFQAAPAQRDARTLQLQLNDLFGPASDQSLRQEPLPRRRQG